MEFFNKLVYPRWQWWLTNLLIVVIFIVIIILLIGVFKGLLVKFLKKVCNLCNFDLDEFKGLILLDGKYRVLYKSRLGEKILNKFPDLISKNKYDKITVSGRELDKSFEIAYQEISLFYFKLFLIIIKDLEYKENYELIKTAVDKISDIIFITNEEGKIIFANKAFSDVTGYSFEEYYQKTPAILKSGKMSSDYYENLWKELLNNRPINAVVTNKRKSGEEFIYNQNITVLQEPAAGKRYFISTGRDVTQEEKNKNNLLMERNNFRTIFNQASNFLLKVNMEAQVLEINDCALNAVSKRREYFLDKSICVFLNELSIKCKEETFLKNLEKLFIELNGADDRTYRLKSTSLNGETVLIEISDITESVRAEFFLQSKNSILEFQIEKQLEELAFEKNKLFAFLNGISTPLIILNSDFGVEFMNEYSKKSFNIKDKEEELYFEKHVIEEDLGLLKDRYCLKDESSDDNITFDAKYIINEKRIYMLWTLSNISFDDNDSNFILIGDDISNIKELITKQEELLSILRKRTKDMQCLYSISEITNRSLKSNLIIEKVLNIVNNIWANEEEIRIEIDLFNKKYLNKKFEEEELIYECPFMVSKEKGEILVYKNKNSVFTEDIVSFINSISSLLSSAIEKNIFEEKLIENQEKLIELQKIGNLGTWEYYMEENLLILSDVSKKILGFDSLEEVNINDFLSHLVGEDKEKLLSVMDELKIEDNQKELSIGYSRKGQLINLFIQLKSTKDYKATKILGTIYEITDFVEIQNQLEKAKIEAENSNKSKSTFLANMSHEIRTPLNAVLGFSQILLRSSSLTEEDKKQVKIINNSGEHLLSIINDILDISKVESGQVEVQLSKFNLIAILEDVKNMFFHKAEEKQIIFNVNYNEETPKYIIGDSKKLRQILVNLLGNAFKFTDEGAITLSLFSEKSKEGNYKIKFKIQDTGIGISAEEKDKIFDNFYQASNSRAGTGLGLSITKNLIELLGSQIMVESELYKGTAFEFELEAEGIPQEENKSNNVIGYNYINRSNRKIKALVVDDVIENVTLLSALLRNIDADVYIGLTATEGLNVFDRLDFDIIFMDILLPDLNGKEVIKRIRKYKDRIKPVIVGVSASIFTEDVQEVLDAGADDFLPKPINIEDVYLLLNKYLDLNLVQEAIMQDETKSNDEVLNFNAVVLDEATKEKFYSAIEQGDFFAIGNLIEEISDSNIKNKLKEYLDNFDYAKIKELIDLCVGTNKT